MQYMIKTQNQKSNSQNKHKRKPSETTRTKMNWPKEVFWTGQSKAIDDNRSRTLNIQIVISTSKIQNAERSWEK